MDKWKVLLAGLIAIAAGVVYATHTHAAAPAAKIRPDGSGYVYYPVNYTVP